MSLLFLPPILFLTLWALVLARAAASRCTVSDATLLRYLVLGMLLGPVVVHPAHRLLNPYDDAALLQLPAFTTLLAAVALLALLSPLVIFHFRRRVHVVTSVADAFLLAFTLGLGFDLFGLLLASSGSFNAIQQLTLLPPWQQKIGGVTVAGTGYRLGLVALAVATMQRAGWRPRTTAAAAGAVLLIVSAEGVAWRWPTESLGVVAASARAALRALTSGGSLTAWFALIAVLFACWWEQRWVDRALNGRPVPWRQEGRRLFADEWRHILRAVRDSRLHQLGSIRRQFSLRRQAEIGLAELSRRTGDGLLRMFVPTLLTRLHALDNEDPRVADAAAVAAADPPAARPGPLKSPALRPDARWLLPAGTGLALLWLTFLGVALAAWQRDAVLEAALMLLVAGWFVTAPERAGPPGDADDLVRFYGESSLVTAALGACLLAFVGALSGPLRLSDAVSLQLSPGDGRTDLALVVLLLAVLGAAVALRPSSGRRSVDYVDHRALVRRSAMVVTAFGGAWATARFFTYGVTTLHERYGQIIVVLASFDPATELPPDLPSWVAHLPRFHVPAPFGNDLAAWIMTIVTGSAIVAAVWVAHAVARRAGRPEHGADG